MCEIEGIYRIIEDKDGNILGAEVRRKGDGKKIYVPIGTPELEKFLGLEIDRSSVIREEDWKDAALIIDYCKRKGIDPVDIVCLKPKIYYHNGEIEGKIKIREKKSKGEERIKEEYIPLEILEKTESYSRFIKEIERDFNLL